MIYIIDFVIYFDGSFEMEEKRLLLIDGNSIINRAYFALPEMDNGEGLKTNAIYGFLTMMFKMIKEYRPTHISVAFDVKSPTFRHKEYSDYKAGRKKNGSRAWYAV